MKINLGKIKPGTAVHPLQVRGDVYQVQLEDGQIGWVYFTMLKETQKMEMTKATALYERKGSSSYRMGKFLDSLKKVVKREKFIWYYTEFQVYENQHRYQGISFLMKNG
jgi:hypothetical protein